MLAVHVGSLNHVSYAGKGVLYINYTVLYYTASSPMSMIGWII